MIISKRAVIFGGIACIFFFALLNRIQVIQKSERVSAYAESVLKDDNTQHFLSYIYKGKSYKRIGDGNIFLKDKTEYTLLIINENLEDFLVFNFMGFWFVAVLASCIITSAWLLFAQVFFEKVVNFKLSFGKEKTDEIKDE